MDITKLENLMMEGVNNSHELQCSSMTVKTSISEIIRDKELCQLLLDAENADFLDH